MGAFLHFMTLAVDLPIGLWPVTVGLTILGAWSLYRLFVLNRLRTWPSCILLVASVLFLVGMPFYAIKFWADPRIHTPETQELPVLVLGILMYGYLGLVPVTVFFAKGYRWPLAGVGALLVWMNSGIALVAIMAVSGLWL